MEVVHKSISHFLYRALCMRLRVAVIGVSIRGVPFAQVSAVPLAWPQPGCNVALCLSCNVWQFWSLFLMHVLCVSLHVGEGFAGIGFGALSFGDFKAEIVPRRTPAPPGCPQGGNGEEDTPSREEEGGVGGRSVTRRMAVGCIALSSRRIGVPTGQ